MMGVSMFVGSKEYRICNAVAFNSFLNNVSGIGTFPELLLRSFSEGVISLKHDGEPELFNSSVYHLLSECKKIESSNRLTVNDKYVLERIVGACEDAIANKKDIDLQ